MKKDTRTKLQIISTKLEEITRTDSDERIHIFTDQKELMELSAQINALLEKHQKIKVDYRRSLMASKKMLSNISHDIKTPLTSIIGYADLLRSRPMTESQVRENAGYIFSEGRRLEALSRKLMDLIVLDRHDFPLREVPLDVFLQRVDGDGLAVAVGHGEVRQLIAGVGGDGQRHPRVGVGETGGCGNRAAGDGRNGDSAGSGAPARHGGNCGGNIFFIIGHDKVAEFFRFERNVPAAVRPLARLLEKGNGNQISIVVMP